MDGEDLGLIDGSGTEEVEVSNEESFIEDEGASEVAAAETESKGAEPSEEQQDGEQESLKRVDRADLPLQIRKALRSNPEIAKQFPRLEKQISAALFKGNQIDSMGGIQKVREIAETIDAHGGVEGIAEMSQELDNWRAFDRGLETGDTRIVDGWLKDYLPGVKTMLPAVLEKLDAMDSPAADAALAPSMWKIHDRCGVISTLGALENAIAKLDPEKSGETVQQFKLLKGFFSDLRALAVKSKSPDPLVNERKALADKEAEFTEREQTTFHAGVKSEVNAIMTQRINRLIRQELNGSKLKLSQANRLRKNIVADLRESVGTEKPQYLDRFAAIMRTGDKTRVVKFAISQADAKLPGIVRRLISEFNLKRGSGNAANSSAGRGGGIGARSIGRDTSGVVNGRPKTSEVDFARTDKARWIATMNSHGEAVLLNGKRAKW
jgi:hypothetical protein